MITRLKEFEKAAAVGNLSLVSNNSALLFYVDLVPGYTYVMHRTKSINYGILIGVAECVMYNDTSLQRKRGDITAQGYKKHAWRNPSDKEWCRMMFVLQPCKPLQVGDQKFGEDLGNAVGIPDSK